MQTTYHLANTDMYLLMHTVYTLCLAKTCIIGIVCFIPPHAYVTPSVIQERVSLITSLILMLLLQECVLTRDVIKKYTT